jgi:peroxin-10
MVGYLLLAQYSIRLIKSIAGWLAAPPARADLQEQQQASEEGGRDLNCVICLEQVAGPSMTPCGHVACWLCLTRYVKEKEECPTCRHECTAGTIVFLRNF